MKNAFFSTFWLFALLLYSSSAFALDSIGCLIQPDDTIELSTPVSGMVAEVLVHRGDRVAAGDVIARLNTDVDDITLSLARARATDRSGVEARIARLEFLEQQAARLTELAEREAVSTAMRDEAVSEANVARSELAQARAELEIAKLYGDNGTHAEQQAQCGKAVWNCVAEFAHWIPVFFLLSPTFILHGDEPFRQWNPGLAAAECPN